MQDYSNNSPSYKATVSIFQTTDKNHADTFNACAKQLADNTFANRAEITKLNGWKVVDGVLYVPDGAGQVVDGVLVLSSTT